MMEVRYNSDLQILLDKIDQLCTQGYLDDTILFREMEHRMDDLLDLHRATIRILEDYESHFRSKWRWLWKVTWEDVEKFSLIDQCKDRYSERYRKFAADHCIEP